MDRANSAFVSWKLTCNSDVAREFLFALLFREKDRS